jgi:hypothetical protein
MKSHEQKVREVTGPKALELGKFRSGDQLGVLCGRDIPTFTILVVDPEKGLVIVDPEVTGQQGTGHRTLGCRPLPEGSKANVSKKADPNIRWGELTLGQELIFRSEDTFFETEGVIFYTSQLLTGIIDLEGR